MTTYDSILNLTTESDKALLIVGITTALKSGTITIEDAEHIAFSPRVIDTLKEMKLSEELEDILLLGTELEDVESLQTYRLDEAITNIQQLALKLVIPTGDME